MPNILRYLANELIMLKTKSVFNQIVENFLPCLEKHSSQPAKTFSPTWQKSFPFLSWKPFPARLYIIRYVIFPVYAHKVLFYVVEHIFLVLISMLLPQFFVFSPKIFSKSFGSSEISSTFASAFGKKVLLKKRSLKDLHKTDK